MNGHVAGLVEQHQVVTLRPSLGLTEVLGQALPVRTDGADHCHLVLAAQLCDEVDVAVPPVQGYVPSFHLIALGNICIDAFADRLGRTPDIVLCGLSSRFSGTNMHLVGEGELGIVERTVRNTELPRLSYFEKVTVYKVTIPPISTAFKTLKAVFRIRN